MNESRKKWCAKTKVMIKATSQQGQVFFIILIIYQVVCQTY